MARLAFPLAVAGALLAPSVDAFVGPSVPLSTSVPISAYRSATSRPQHYSSSVLRTSTAVLPTCMSAAGAAVVPSVKPPADMYQHAVNVGEKKAAMPAAKTFLMGIISGCHIALGALLAVTVGGNCPGLAASNPGLQKILFGAFGGSTCLRKLMSAFPLYHKCWYMDSMPYEYFYMLLSPVIYIPGTWYYVDVVRCRANQPLRVSYQQK